MAAATVPHGTAVWKMFAGGALAEPTATTAVTKALKIASAYFTKLIVPGPGQRTDFDIDSDDNDN